MGPEHARGGRETCSCNAMPLLTWRLLVETSDFIMLNLLFHNADCGSIKFWDDFQNGVCKLKRHPCS